MFIYEVKELYNEAGEGPFSGMVVKPGTEQIPAVAGETVLAVIENEGVLELLEEFVVGEKPGEQEGPYFYLKDGESGEITKLNTPYVLSEEYYLGNDEGNWFIQIPADAEWTVVSPVCVEIDTPVTCTSATGYDFPVTAENVELDDYDGLGVHKPDVSDELLFNKTVQWYSQQVPAVDVVISTGGATFSCTVAQLPMA